MRLTCKLYLNYAGYCLAKANHAVKGEIQRDIQFKALYGLIEHPVIGWILFDSGYTRRFYDATSNWPNKIYALATKVNVEEQDEIKYQLQKAGISPNEVNHIIISHFHADHIGGLRDFPNAKFYCSRSAWQQVLNISDFFAFSKGILKSLLPQDILERLFFIEDIAVEKYDEIFGKVYDLFNDHSILAFHLPGHAAGQIGIQLQTAQRSYFLVADACWDKRAYELLYFPHPIVKVFFHSWKDYKESIDKLRIYWKKNPTHQIIPSHCSLTTDCFVSANIDMDVL